MTSLGIGVGITDGGAGFTPASLPGLVWDSGESPALASAVPGTVSVNTANCEVWAVSRGHAAAVLDLGSGSQAMYYAGGVAASTAALINWLDGGGIRNLKTNTFWPRVAPAVHGYRGNGANSLIAHLNGVTYPAVGVATTTTTGGTVGQRTIGGFALEGAVNRVLLYSANLTAAQRLQLQAYLRTRYGIQAYTKQVLCAGDSITAGYNPSANFILNGWTAGDYTHSYPYYLMRDHPDWKVFNHGITSVTINTMTTNDTTGIDPNLDATNFAKNVCVVFAGTNDVVVDAVDQATLRTRVATYCAARKSAGFQVVYVPMLDRTDFTAGMRTIKNDFNTWLSGGGLGANCDVLATLPAGLSGDSPWVGSPTLWDADQTHLTRAGYQTLAGAVSTAVTAA